MQICRELDSLIGLNAIQFHVKFHTVSQSVPHSSPVPHSMFQSLTGLFVAFWKFHTYSTNLHTWVTNLA